MNKVLKESQTNIQDDQIQAYKPEESIMRKKKNLRMGNYQFAVSFK